MFTQSAATTHSTQTPVLLQTLTSPGMHNVLSGTGELLGIPAVQISVVQGLPSLSTSASSLISVSTPPTQLCNLQSPTMGATPGVGNPSMLV
jgi:hypothetical protein